jgi:hypothetical protein
VPYAVENALFQWRDGDRRLREAPPERRAALEGATAAVLDELRRRLGSRFTIAELADFYARGADWAQEVAERRGAGLEASAVVDAAFGRYVREAADYAGGRAHDPLPH